MRCPYCGGLNPDRTSFCIRCGRNISTQGTAEKRQLPQPPQPPQQVQRPANPQPQRPNYPQPKNPNPGVQQKAPPYQPAGPAPQPPRPSVSVAPAPPPSQNPATARSTRPSTPTITPHAPTPALPAESPVPFPPRTVEQLKALEKNAQTYSLVGDSVNYGKKKIVRIAYYRCPPWQQIATLLKALKDHDSPKFDTIVIQGVTDRDTNAYWYNNGQLTFDRNARLGSQTLNRYQIETNDGLSSDSERIVLSE